MGKQVQQRPPKRLPATREHFAVSEVAEFVAARDGGIAKSIANAIYRQIEQGKVRAVRVLGVTKIPRTEALRIVEGERA